MMAAAMAVRVPPRTARTEIPNTIPNSPFQKTGATVYVECLKKSCARADGGHHSGAGGDERFGDNGFLRHGLASRSDSQHSHSTPPAAFTCAAGLSQRAI